MSNVKKCLIFKNKKNQNRDYLLTRRPGFLLLDFVITLGIAIISIAVLGKLLHVAVQTQRAMVQKAHLVDNMVELANNRAGGCDLAVHRYQAQLIFDEAAHGAWCQRWRGQSILPEQPIRLALHEVDFQGGKNLFRSGV